MNWWRTWRADPLVAALADSHYSRRTPGAAQFSPPGRNITLRTWTGDAGWVTTYSLPEFVDHEWGDCWTCSLFRNEGEVLSSLLVTEAVAATCAEWGEIPPGGFLTFVDAGKVRRKRDPGRCFRRAGFAPVGFTKDRGLVVLRLIPELFPQPINAESAQLAMPLAD